ncbi:TniB family NTP-binding protein, partial [Vibrio rotiferianus]
MQSKDKKTTTVEQLIEAIDAKVVASTQYEEASKCLDSMLVFAGTKSKGMMLFGDTGLGKTTVLRKFEQRHNVKLAAKVSANLIYPVDVVPIVRINMDARPTVKIVCRDILKKTGHPELTGTASELQDRIDNLILEQHLQILVIDECQHLLKKNAGAHASSVLNFLKNLMREENKLVVIFAGMPVAENALNDHPEIRRRLNYRRCYMRPFTNETNAEFKNFASLLAAFD